MDVYKSFAGGTLSFSVSASSQYLKGRESYYLLMRALEERYAAAHSYLHFCLVDPSEVALTRKRLLGNSHGLLHYKHVLVSHSDVAALPQLMEEIAGVTDHQREVLSGKLLEVRHSHNKLLQSDFARRLEHSSVLQHDKDAVLVALSIAEKHFPKGSFSALTHQLYVEKTLDPLVAHIILAAAHDAHHFGSLKRILEGQSTLLADAVRITNRDVLAQVHSHLRSSFDDEIHTLAMLDHQGLHDWAVKNTFARR